MPRRPRLVPAAARAPDTLLFQGGGALGAYEWGVYEALHEAGYAFGLVAGVSIGAANAAIVASRGREATTYLGRFWDALADPLAEAPAPTESARRQWAAMKSVFFGNPAMFRPRWLREPWSLARAMQWTSLYDPAPFRELVGKMVDFSALGTRGPELLVTAVDIQSGLLTAFHSHEERFTADHILASGALPPAFPPVSIRGRSYWDGGIVSNTPLGKVLERGPPEAERRVVLIELFPRHHQMPRNLAQVLATAKDLTYMTKVDLDSERAEHARVVREFLDTCESSLPSAELARLKARGEFQVLREGCRHHVHFHRISHGMEEGELDSKDYDFSPASLRRHREEGRRAGEAHVRAWEREPGWSPFRGAAAQAVERATAR